MSTPAAPTHVVAIGASAGGLESLSVLLPLLLPTGSVAYVIAQHMAQSGHAELLLRLLSQHSALPLRLATDGCPLQADVVYLLPAGFHGEIGAGKLQLFPRETGTLSCPSASRLFCSLATSYAERGIAVVLSGTGSDGAAGCVAVQQAGGTVFVQDSRSAQYDGMPQAALAITGNTQALEPAALPVAIYERVPGQHKVEGEGIYRSTSETLINELMTCLHDVTGTDLRGYKEETLLRRTAKRVSALQLDSLETYLAYARSNRAELELLKRQLFVTVSSFFRDPASFAALAAHLRAALLVRSAEPFNVWVPGCGTGEEVYSLAMLLQDLARQLGIHRELRITGTDLNEAALAQAATASYADGLVRAMPEEFRNHYMVKNAGQFEVVPAIRDLCSFEPGDVFGSQVPNHVDLISCRNLLIYLRTPRQQRLVRQMHGQLRVGGLLFLGQSESLTPAERPLFSTLNADHRIFCRRAILADPG